MTNLGKHNKWWFGLASLIAAALFLGGWLMLSKPAPLPLQKITLALPAQLATASLFVAIDNGYFSKHGLDVTHQPYALGLQSLNAVLANKADLAIVANTPFMFNVLNGEKIAIVATTFNSRRAAAVVARRDRGIAGMADLTGKTIGVSLGTNMQFFMDTMLLVNGVDKNSVTIVDLKPEQLIDALQSGRVDALAAWHPFLAQLQTRMGDQVLSMYGEDDFSFRFNLVGRQKYIASNQAALRKVLAAIDDANQFMQRDPVAAQTIISRYVKMEQQTLTKVFDPRDFQLKLDQSLLLSLDDQTRWAIKNGLSPVTTVPNYLDFMHFDALKAVQPTAVTMIR